MQYDNRRFTKFNDKNILLWFTEQPYWMRSSPSTLNPYVNQLNNIADYIVTLNLVFFFFYFNTSKNTNKIT